MSKNRITASRLIIYGLGMAAIIVYLLLMDNTTLTDKKTSVSYCSIVPAPQSAIIEEGIVILGVNSKIYFAQEEIKPAANLLSRDIYRITNHKIPLTQIKSKQADISIAISKKMASQAYSIKIDKDIKIKAGSIQSAKEACVSLAQICLHHAGRASFPKIKIEDFPQSEYRGLLLDVARKWHSPEDIKKVIETCRWYKINYLQLHLTDDQSFTFPSSAFPELATPGRHYSKEELVELEGFALDHGVQIIPELEIPGHSSLMRKVEPFGLEGLHVINMLDEKVYTALDTLIGEFCSIFQASPYFHIGADECWMEGVGESPAEKIFMKKEGLQDHADVYNYFIVRMNEIVKSHNKKTLVWEGFKGQGSENVKIPHDITVFAWESLYQRPDSLLANGYTIINAAWKPLYIVPKRSWTPEYIHGWNMYRFENWWEITPAFEPIQVDSTEQIIGAQMCAWENEPQYDFPAIQWRLPAMSDRIWIPTLKGDFESYTKRHAVQNKKLDQVLYPFSLTTEGLPYFKARGIDQRMPYTFENAVWLKPKMKRKDLVLRYTTDSSTPKLNSPPLPEELKASTNTFITIQAFNTKNQRVGYSIRLPLEKKQAE